MKQRRGNFSGNCTSNNQNRQRKNTNGSRTKDAIYFSGRKSSERVFDRRQSGQRDRELEERIRPQQLQQPRQQPQQQETEEGEEEEGRLKTRQEYEREATIRRELEDLQRLQELVQNDLRRMQEGLRYSGSLRPEQQQIWQLQMERLEALQHREVTLRQRQRVVQQQSRILDQQYQVEKASRQLMRVQSRQGQVREQLEIRRQLRMLRELRNRRTIRRHWSRAGARSTGSARGTYETEAARAAATVTRNGG